LSERRALGQLFLPLSHTESCSSHEPA
jgi:hypothetical protein